MEMTNMVTIRAHYDGKVIVPEDTVDLPVNQPLQLRIVEATDVPEETPLSKAEIESRKAAFERFLARSIQVPDIPLEALRRENLYADDGLTDPEYVSHREL
jgi:hypothetical protein